MAEKRVPPYPQGPQTRKELITKTFEYHMPFNYENITVNRRHLTNAMEFHGVEMNAVNSIGADDQHLPPDTIKLVEDNPIVRVVVIGSACVPPAYITVEAKVTDDFRRPEDVTDSAAARFRINNLWGMHMRADNWLANSDGPIRDEVGREYGGIPEARVKLKPGMKKYRMKSHYRENPLIGMSCAIFEIPQSNELIISGGSEICAWTDDNYPDDVHYSFRIIRTTVLVSD